METIKSYFFLFFDSNYLQLQKLSSFDQILSLYSPENRKPKVFLMFEVIYIIEMNHCLKLVNNHGMLATSINKIKSLFLYDFCLSVILPIPQTTLSFFMLSFCCHYTWHRCLYFAKSLVDTLFQQSSVFVKDLTLSPVLFNLFNK